MKEFIDQALHHFMTAKEINSGLFHEYEDSRQFHPFILMMIGKCFIEQKKFLESLEYLEKALQINEQQIGKEHVSNVNIITDLAFAHSKKGNHSHSLTLYNKAIGIVEKTFGPQSETIASLDLDIAKTYESLGNYAEAIKYQQQALGTQNNLITILGILGNNESTDTIVLANIYITLAEWCTKIKQFDTAIESIKRVLL